MKKIAKNPSDHLLGVTKSRFSELCGWYGMSALIVAYCLVSFGCLDGQGLIFQIINVTGGVGLLIVGASKGVVQSVILNAFWTIIGVAAIARSFFNGL